MLAWTENLEAQLLSLLLSVDSSNWLGKVSTKMIVLFLYTTEILFLVCYGTKRNIATQVYKVRQFCLCR